MNVDFVWEKEEGGLKGSRWIREGRDNCRREVRRGPREVTDGKK